MNKVKLVLFFLIASISLSYGETPNEKLLNGARTGDLGLAAMKAAISSGADLNFQDKEGNTALMIVASRGPIYGIEKSLPYLLSLNPDIDLKNLRDQNINDIINNSNDPKLYEIFYNSALISSNEKLLGLAHIGDHGLKGIQDAVQAGADVNTRDKQGNTALMILADTINYDIEQVLKYLLSQGADIYFRNWNGENAIDKAKYSSGTIRNPTFLAIVHQYLKYTILKGIESSGLPKDLWQIMYEYAIEEQNILNSDYLKESVYNNIKEYREEMNKKRPTKTEEERIKRLLKLETTPYRMKKFRFIPRNRAINYLEKIATEAKREGEPEYT